MSQCEYIEILFFSMRLYIGLVGIPLHFTHCMTPKWTNMQFNIVPFFTSLRVALAIKGEGNQHEYTPDPCLP